MDQVVKRANKGRDARSRSSSKQAEDVLDGGQAVASGSATSKADIEWQFVVSQFDVGLSLDVAVDH